MSKSVLNRMLSQNQQKLLRHFGKDEQARNKTIGDLTIDKESGLSMTPLSVESLLFDRWVPGELRPVDQKQFQQAVQQEKEALELMLKQ